MGHGMSKKKEMRIAELKVAKKRAFWRAVICLVVIIALLALKTLLFNLGVEWVSSTEVNLALFIIVIVAAAVTGTGLSKMKKAGDELKFILSKNK